MSCIPIKNGILCVSNSYSAAMEDAARRKRAGQHQEYCWEHGLWCWTGESGHNLSGIRTMRQLEKYAEELTEHLFGKTAKKAKHK